MSLTVVFLSKCCDLDKSTGPIQRSVYFHILKISVYVLFISSITLIHLYLIYQDIIVKDFKVNNVGDLILKIF